MSKTQFSFELITQDERARLGRIKTPKGKIDTPAFMPVGTQGTLKGIFTDDVLKTGTQIILANTYHLLLRPGVDILKKFNGLNRFMNWNKPILTDSGGYQIMSLSKLNKIDVEIGAIFRSHLDREYSVFGKVIKGMEFVDMIKKGDPNSGSVSDPDKIISLKSK